nr:hypothetical protein [Tanacetum cinerariifolium]
MGYFYVCYHKSPTYSSFTSPEMILENNNNNVGELNTKRAKVTLIEGNTFTIKTTGQAAKVAAIPRGMPAATTASIMAISNFDGPGYSKETIRVEYEWEPPRCSTCLIFGNSVDDCPKAPKRLVNRVDKGMGGSSGADDEALN